MLLLNIRDYIQLRGSVNLTDLARHFDVPESAIQQMTEQWVNKGKIIAISSNQTCNAGSCGGCHQNSNSQSCYNRYQVLYRWNLRSTEH